MALDQSLACSIDSGRAKAKLAFFIDSDNDAACRSAGCRTCSRKEFHTQGPFLAKAVKNHLCGGARDAENEGSGEAQTFELVVERPPGHVNQGLSRTFQKR